jgi:hypothetical protein
MNFLKIKMTKEKLILDSLKNQRAAGQDGIIGD